MSSEKFFFPQYALLQQILKLTYIQHQITLIYEFVPGTLPGFAKEINIKLALPFKHLMPHAKSKKRGRRERRRGEKDLKKTAELLESLEQSMYGRSNCRATVSQVNIKRAHCVQKAHWKKAQLLTQNIQSPADKPCSLRWGQISKRYCQDQLLTFLCHQKTS